MKNITGKTLTTTEQTLVKPTISNAILRIYNRIPREDIAVSTANAEQEEILWHN